MNRIYNKERKINLENERNKEIIEESKTINLKIVTITIEDIEKVITIIPS